MNSKTNTDLYEEWKELLKDYDGTELSRKAWLEKHGKTLSQLKYWKGILSKNANNDSKQNKLETAWVKVEDDVIEGKGNELDNDINFIVEEPVIIIRINNFVVEVSKSKFDSTLLKQVVETLEEVIC